MQACANRPLQERDFPKGIWDDEDTVPEKEVPKLWKFNVNSRLGTHEDQDESESHAFTWGGTGTTDQATQRLPGMAPGSPMSSIELKRSVC